MVGVENSENIGSKLESYGRPFKRFESVARRTLELYSQFTDEEGRAATRDLGTLGGGSYSKEAEEGVTGWFGIRNMGASARDKHFGFL